MKYTLLDLVQTVLSSTDGDEVNSINDSVEAQQIATIVRTAYFDILARANLPEHYSLVTLDASIDNTKPTLMTLPSTVDKLMWIKYNTATIADPEINMKNLTPMPLEDFMNYTYQFDVSDPDVGSFQHTIGADTFTVLYYKNNGPTYYTTFNDRTILFDSYDATIDSTLQKSKTLCCGKLVIPFTMADDFTPDLDGPQFTLLLNECKALAWQELKQTQHPKAEQNARRGWTNLQKSKQAIEGLSDLEYLPDFGRRGVNHSRSPFRART